MFGLKKKTSEVAPTTAENKPVSGFVKFGSAALAAIVVGGGLGAASTHVDKIPGTPVAASSEPGAPASTDITPVTPDSTTYTIPSSEVPVTTPSEAPAPAPVTTTPEAPVTNMVVEAPAATEVIATSEAASTIPAVEVPTLSVAEYESQPAELIRAFVEKDLQAWANASANAETVQAINARLAQGEDLASVCADIAHDNTAAFAPALFGENYANVPSIVASVDTFTEVNAETLESYYKTANDDTKYLAIITGISPQVYDDSKTKHLVQGAVSISIANNGNDTTLGADKTVRPVEKYNVLLEDSTNSGNYTVTAFSQ